jgi:Fusaric acid resistance protein-like
LKPFFHILSPHLFVVLITVLFVCWFPALDAASVIEKVMQRLIGTFVGAVIGLTCGFASIIVYDERGDSRLQQSIFLGICFFAFNFLIVFLSGQVKVGGVTVLNRFSYATILCVLTFCICILPFASNSRPKWKHGVWRIINVIVGCILGAIGSIVIFPKSTNDVLFEKTTKQVRLAGEASEAVLQTAADYFAGRVTLKRWADEMVTQPLESSMRWKFKRSRSGPNDDSSVDLDVNVAMKKYEDAILDWRATKALFPIAKYDPFAMELSRHTLSIQSNIHANSYKGYSVHLEIARTLARALRIQTTIIVLDGMIRNDAHYDFTSERLHLFSSIGKLIRTMLTVPLELQISNDAACVLFDKLEEIREGIKLESTKVSETRDTMDQRHQQGIQKLKNNLLADVTNDKFSESTTVSPTKQSIIRRKKSSSFNSLVVLNLGEDDADEEGRGIPHDATNQYENTLFFLQLVEHLILRSLRLYQAWKHVEVKSD